MPHPRLRGRRHARARHRRKSRRRVFHPHDDLRDRRRGQAGLQRRDGREDASARFMARRLNRGPRGLARRSGAQVPRPPRRHRPAHLQRLHPARRLLLRPLFALGRHWSMGGEARPRVRSHHPLPQRAHRREDHLARQVPDHDQGLRRRQLRQRALRRQLYGSGALAHRRRALPGTDPDLVLYGAHQDDAFVHGRGGAPRVGPPPARPRHPACNHHDALRHKGLAADIRLRGQHGRGADAPQASHFGPLAPRPRRHRLRPRRPRRGPRHRLLRRHQGPTRQRPHQGGNKGRTRAHVRRVLLGVGLRRCLAALQALVLSFSFRQRRDSTSSRASRSSSFRSGTRVGEHRGIMPFPFPPREP
mmetsp:Transcript_27313/g.97625  ORF Transcript_27313/g.97625 Transcript_27313/m.97625 type:complete len:360 (+) Transcript_27313:1496-2575(+)